jgi:hypothetical protein
MVVTGVAPVTGAVTPGMAAILMAVSPPPPVSLPSPQAAKENPIIATMAIITKNLLLFRIKHAPFY